MNTSFTIDGISYRPIENQEDHVAVVRIDTDKTAITIPDEVTHEGKTWQVSLFDIDIVPDSGRGHSFTFRNSGGAEVTQYSRQFDYEGDNQISEIHFGPHITINTPMGNAFPKLKKITLWPTTKKGSVRSTLFDSYHGQMIFHGTPEELDNGWRMFYHPACDVPSLTFEFEVKVKEPAKVVGNMVHFTNWGDGKTICINRNEITSIQQNSRRMEMWYEETFFCQIMFSGYEVHLTNGDLIFMVDPELPEGL